MVLIRSQAVAAPEGSQTRAITKRDQPACHISLRNDNPLLVTQGACADVFDYLREHQNEVRVMAPPPGTCGAIRCSDRCSVNICPVRCLRP